MMTPARLCFVCKHADTRAQVWTKTVSELAPRDTRDLAKFLAASPRAGLGASAHFLQQKLQNPSLPMEHEPMELHSVSQSIDFVGLWMDTSVPEPGRRTWTRVNWVGQDES